MNERTEKPQNDAPAPLARGSERPYTRPQDERGRPMTGRGTEHFAGPGGRSGEPLSRTERLLITMFITMFAATLGAGALGFTALSGQLLDMQTQLGGQLLDMQTQMGSQLLGVQTQMGSQLLGVQKQIGGLSERVGNLEGRMATLEGRMATLEERMTSVETLIQTRLVPQPGASSPSGL